MIDPILSLALSMHSNKGVYALLVGSGISRASGIPTGWEISLDIIRKLAILKNEDCEPKPEDWYKKTFGEEPNYDTLLNQIAKTQSERSNLLKAYFEPNEEELEQGLKVSTKAHKAIAELVKNGFVRIIITTNFDRLIEQALEDKGIVPTVISSPDAAEGAFPITHTKCTIIKVNGDYLDTRIKNTPDELAKYDKRMNQLLNSVFDEFGLVICGWSADWDVALRKRIESTKGHRFTTYWAARGEPEKVIQKLIKLRRGQTIKIIDADSFFQEVVEKIHALDNISFVHPLSPKIAVATLKKYLVDDLHEIRLNDFVSEETEHLYKELNTDNFPPQTATITDEEIIERVRSYEELSQVLLPIVINGCYWGKSQHINLWSKSLERIANVSDVSTGLDVWIKLQSYPALLLLYGGGIASVASEKYDNFAALLTNGIIRDKHSGNDHKIIESLHASEVIERSIGQKLPGQDRKYTPLNNHLFDVLRKNFLEIIPDNNNYQRLFDKFEYLQALVYADLRFSPDHNIWGPVGCFGWRYNLFRENNILDIIQQEANSAGDDWSLLKTGLFGSSIDRFTEVKNKFDDFVGRVSRSWF